jgi:hypothetical protein
MQFIEEDEKTIEGQESFSNMKYWQLSDIDGVKTIKVKFQDYGGNRTLNIDKTFRILYDIETAQITDIALQKSDENVWMAVNTLKGNIYKFTPNTSYVTEINEKINAITFYDDVLYIAAKTSDYTGLVYRYTGFVIEQVLL